MIRFLLFCAVALSLLILPKESKAGHFGFRNFRQRNVVVRQNFVVGHRQNFAVGYRQNFVVSQPLIVPNYAIGRQAVVVPQQSYISSQAVIGNGCSAFFSY